MTKVKTKKTLRVLNREAICNRPESPREPDAIRSVTKTVDWSPEELTRIWRNTSG